MTQTTNDHDEDGYAWARKPGSSSTYPAAAAQASDDNQSAPTTPFAAPDGSRPWAPATTGADTAAIPAGSGDVPAGTAPGTPGGSAAPATPAATGGPAPTSASPTFGPAYGPGYGPGYNYPAGPAGPSGAYPASSYPAGDSASGGQPPVPPSTGRRIPRRPGWGGVVATGVGAAVLSSLLTAGIVVANQDDSTTVSSTSASSQAQVKAPVTSSNASSPDWGAVAKAVEPSVVAVQVSSQTASGEGSGVILDKTGRIVTNNHVVSGAGSGATLEVVLSDGRKYSATVVGTDSATDLAVIKLTDPPSDLTPATFGTTSAVAVGDPVMAVGNPLGLAGTVTTGIVSATDRPTTTTAESTDPNSAGTGDPVVTNAIQTDAAVNPGNSGGALVDSQGRVIGVPSSIASLSDSSSFGQSSQSGSIGLGFAIPVDEVKDVTSQLIKGGTVEHSWLGVGTADGSVKVNGANRDAAILKTISSGSPAQKAGLKAGDAVIAVDGETVNGYLSLVGQLRERPVNSSVALTIVRGGKSSQVKVILGARPSSAN